MKFAAIVLAAGAGRRFGGGKLVTPYRGVPLIHHAIAAAQSAPVDEIIVVVGADAAVVRAALPLGPVSVVEARDWAAGMSASLKTGVAALGEDHDGAYIFLGDMPAIPHTILEPLAAAVRAGALGVAPVYQGRRGHPVLLARSLLKQVSNLSGDKGAAALLQDIVLVPASDPGVCFDVDEVADLLW